MADTQNNDLGRFVMIYPRCDRFIPLISMAYSPFSHHSLSQALTCCNHWVIQSQPTQAKPCFWSNQSEGQPIHLYSRLNLLSRNGFSTINQPNLISFQVKPSLSKGKPSVKPNQQFSLNQIPQNLRQHQERLALYLAPRSEPIIYPYKHL